MKSAGLEKLKGLKISARMNQSGTPGRFGKDAATIHSRREQRAIDQAQGLVPFAVKLDRDLVRRLHALAEERKTGMNELVADLIEKALAG